MKIKFLSFLAISVLLSCSNHEEPINSNVNEQSSVIKSKDFGLETQSTLTVNSELYFIKNQSTIISGSANDANLVKVYYNNVFIKQANVVNGNFSVSHTFTTASTQKQLKIEAIKDNQVVKTSLFWRAVFNSKTPKIPSLVLMYHQIDANTRFPDDVTPTNFRAQMEWLKNNGYTTILTEELFVLDVLPAKSVVITFDDGYIGNYTYAKPILESLNMKADFFVHTDYVGTTSISSWNKISWNQAREMQSSSLFDVHSHSKTHPKLAEITSAQLNSELLDSKNRLQTELSSPCLFIAYPFGSYNLNVLTVVQNSGYLLGYAVGNIGNFGKPAQFCIPRKGIGRDITTIQQFKTRIGV